MPSFNDATKIMVEVVWDNMSVAVYNIVTPEIFRNNDYYLIQGEGEEKLTLPDDVSWKDYSDDIENVWEAKIGSECIVRISYDK